jgi:predicted membrane protein
VDALDRRYELGIGELVFDLRSVEFPLGETRLDVRVDAGRIHVLLPEDVALRAVTEARLGEIDLLDRRVEGWEVDEQVDEAGLRVLVLEAEVGIGEIDIERGLR